MQKILNYIGGEHLEPASERYFDNVEPATGKAYSLVPDSDAADVDLAVKAAKKAFPLWSRTPVAERSRILLDIARRIEVNLDRLAKA